LEFRQSLTESVELPELPRVPDADTWDAMTPEERMDLVRAFRAVLGVGRLRNVFPDPTSGHATTPAWVLNVAPQVEPAKAGRAKAR
jgi:hypothetical protein